MTDLPDPVGPPVDATTPYVPAAVPGRQPVLDLPREPHPTLPVVSAAGAIVVLTVSLLVSKYVLDALLRFEWPVVAYVAMLALLGYGPSLLWVRYVSSRWGTGSLAADVGLTPRFADIGWAPVVWLTAVATQLVVGAILLALDVPLANNTDGIEELSADRTYVVSIVITAVIAAPIVEEVVFRGVVLRGLRSRMPAVAAIALQAVLFGAAHVDPVLGMGNIGLIVVLSGVGAAFGGAAYLLRRIGPTVAAHAIFNGVVLLLVLTRVAERLQD